MFENYDSIRKFITKQYYENVSYGLGSRCFSSAGFRDYIKLWYAWYQGYVEEFHKYSVYNGSDSVNVVRNSLQMAKKLAEDKADLLLNERVDITATDAASDEALKKVLKNNKFRSRANELIELMNALGTGAYVEFIENGKTCIDYLSVDKIIPLTIVNGVVVDCAFASVETHGNESIVYLNTHIMIKPIEATEENQPLIDQRAEMGISPEYEGYIIENCILESSGGEYTIKSDYNAGTEPIILTNTTVPFFQIMKPAKANNLCMDDYGLGLSCYSNALPNLIGTDTAFDSYVNEFNLGRKRLFIHDDMARVKTSTEGEDDVFTALFDPKETLFYSVDLSEDNDKIKSIDPELRVEEHELGLSSMLNLLGFKCGFGNNYYKFEGGVIKTATEVISSDSPLYKSIKKDQHGLREAIVGMCKAILVLENGLGAKHSLDQDITVKFDDSIFEDQQTIMKNALVEYAAGGLSDAVNYYMVVYKLTEEQAIEKVNKIRARSPEPDNIDLMGGGA